MTLVGAFYSMNALSRREEETLLKATKARALRECDPVVKGVFETPLSFIVTNNIQILQHVRPVAPCLLRGLVETSSSLFRNAWSNCKDVVFFYVRFLRACPKYRTRTNGEGSHGIPAVAPTAARWGVIGCEQRTLLLCMNSIRVTFHGVCSMFIQAMNNSNLPTPESQSEIQLYKTLLPPIDCSPLSLDAEEGRNQAKYQSKCRPKARICLRTQGFPEYLR